jgi:hypothetical protein
MLADRSPAALGLVEASGQGGIMSATALRLCGRFDGGSYPPAVQPVPERSRRGPGGLTVTVATFAPSLRAARYVAQLVDEGLPAFTRSKSENGPYQVIVGPYVSAEEATAAQKSLAEKGVAGTVVQIETTDLTQTAWR